MYRETLATAFGLKEPKPAIQTFQPAQIHEKNKSNQLSACPDSNTLRTNLHYRD